MNSQPDRARTHDRVRVAACADVTGSDVLLYHRIRDISEGGMSFGAARMDPVGSQLDVLLTFPRTEAEVPVKAEVAWIADEAAERLVGLRWVDLAPEERAHLRKHIAAAMTSLVTGRDSC